MNWKKKSCTIAERKNDSGNNWSWRSCPITASLSYELNHLSNVIAPTRLQNWHDELSCLLASDGRYKVELLRKKIERMNTCTSNQILIRWCKIILIKVTCFI